jgi:hypothetical protein
MASLLSFEAAKYPLKEEKKGKKGKQQDPAVSPIEQASDKVENSGSSTLPAGCCVPLRGTPNQMGCPIQC